MLNQRISFKMSLPFIWQETLRELVYLGIVTKKEYWATPEKKKPNTGGWAHTFLKKHPGIFRFLTLFTPGNYTQNKGSTLETLQKTVLHPSEILGLKTKTFGNSTLFFLNHTLKIHVIFT